MPSRVVYFTAGTKGVGHLVRGIAIGRALQRHGFDGQFHLVTPIAPLPAMAAAAAEVDTIVCPIDVAQVLNKKRYRSSALARQLAELAPDLLIVDLFWAPVLHIVPTLGCESWLLVRRCPLVWLHGNAEIQFNRHDYRRVIGIEPVEHQQISERIDPIVICNQDECHSRAELAQRFSVDPDRAITFVSHAGLAGEIGSVAPPGQTKGIVIVSDLHGTNSVFPLAPWLNVADAIYCSAGYNSYWEARWLGYADKTTFTAFRRQIDDPIWRLAECGSHSMRSNGADTLATSIISG